MIINIEMSIKDTILYLKNYIHRIITTKKEDIKRSPRHRVVFLIHTDWQDFFKNLRSMITVKDILYSGKRRTHTRHRQLFTPLSDAVIKFNKYRERSKNNKITRSQSIKPSKSEKSCKDKIYDVMKRIKTSLKTDHLKDLSQNYS
jgi:hypothetical protein